MTYFPKPAPTVAEKCPGCRRWFVPTPGMGMTSCTVFHGPGSCCHYSETEVPAPLPETPRTP